MESLVEIGIALKPHGVKGALNIRYEERFEPTFDTLTFLWIEMDGLPAPYRIVNNSVRYKSGNTVVLILEDVGYEESESLYHHKILVEKQDVRLIEDHLGDELDYLLGYTIIDKTTNFSATVKKVENYSGNTLLSVERSGDTFLVPYHPDMVIEITEAEKILTMQLPEGIWGLD